MQGTQGRQPGLAVLCFWYSALLTYFFKYFPFHSTLRNSVQAGWAQRPIQSGILPYMLEPWYILFLCVQ